MKLMLTVMVVFFVNTLAAINLNELPSKVKKTIEKKCKGDVVSVGVDSIKGFMIYEISCEEKNREITYFISENGRLIHTKKNLSKASLTIDEDDEFEEEKPLSKEEKRKLDKELDEEEFDDEDEFEEGDEEFEEEEETVVEVKKNQLPEHIQKAIKENVKGKPLGYAKEVLYFVEAEENGKMVFYIFNHKGKLIEKEVEDAEDGQEFDDDELEDDLDDKKPEEVEDEEE